MNSTFCAASALFCVLCSLRSLARRTYSSEHSPDVLRCGCFAFTSHGRLMGGQVEFWRKTCLSRKTVQRYDEHLGFCKFFGKKMQEKCIFVEFWAKNDDYLERIAILSTANRIDGRTGAKVYRVYKVYINM